jgi:hypothetical protein
VRLEDSAHGCVEARAERPEIETFGENVGVLTSEIFGLEVTDAGFHTMLRDAAARLEDYDSVVESFDNQLGAEARAIVRGLVAGHQAQSEE